MVTISSSVVFLYRVQVCCNLPSPLLLEAKGVFFAIINTMWWILLHIVPTHISDYLSRIKSWTWNFCSSDKYNLKTCIYWQIAIQENCTAVYSHQQCATVPIFLPVRMEIISFPSCGCCILGVQPNLLVYVYRLLLLCLCLRCLLLLGWLSLLCLLNFTYLLDCTAGKFIELCISITIAWSRIFFS